MRKFITFLFVVLFAVGVFAGDIATSSTAADYGGKIINFTVADLDSAENDTSAYFQFQQYDHVSWTTYPFRYQIDASSDPNSGTLKMTFYIQGSLDGTNWAAVDTIANVATYGVSSGTINFNNLKYQYYRMYVDDVRSTTCADTVQDAAVKIWAYQE
jgi:hypothetical protein